MAICPKCGTALATADPQNRQEEQTYGLADVEPLAQAAKVSAIPDIQKEPDGIKFVCSICDETYQVSRDLAGQTIRCRNCGELDRVLE
jgi:DNA-directed RNA polymerase subunit RPC12/RpoP